MAASDLSSKPDRKSDEQNAEQNNTKEQSSQSAENKGHLQRDQDSDQPYQGQSDPIQSYVREKNTEEESSQSVENKGYLQRDQHSEQPYQGQSYPIQPYVREKNTEEESSQSVENKGYLQRDQHSEQPYQGQSYPIQPYVREKNTEEESSQSVENKGHLQRDQHSQQPYQGQSYPIQPYVREKNTEEESSQSVENKGYLQRDQHSEQPYQGQSYPIQPYVREKNTEEESSQSVENKGHLQRDQQHQQPRQGQSYPRQPYVRESQPPIYVLPYPPPFPPAPQPFQVYYQPPPYQGYHQSVNQSPEVQSNEQRSMQSDQPDQKEQQSGRRQTYQQHSGQYGQQSYYGPPHSNVQYVHQCPVHPPSAQGSPMIRPGLVRGGQRDEPQMEGWEGFQDSKIRRLFVRKVYTILMLQLLFSLGVIALFVFEPNVKQFVRENIYLYYISFAIFAGVYIGIACFESMRRKVPTNIIVLIIFTLAASYMLGAISSTFNTEAVFMAVGICAAVCLVVTIFSFYTKYDFTSCGGILCVLLIILILFGLIAIFIPNKVTIMIYAAAGAIVFTLYLAYDTQMLMGGRKFELSPEEYIFATVQIYVDIMYIFLFLLMLLGNNE